MEITIGNKIKERRIELGMTQEELGNKIGVKKAAIHKYEKGIVENIKRSTQFKLAQALQMNPADLFYSDDVSTTLDSPPVKEDILEALSKEYMVDKEGVEMYISLDVEDRAEIRGEMKHMLKSDKYITKKEGLKIG